MTKAFHDAAVAFHRQPSTNSYVLFKYWSIRSFGLRADYALYRAKNVARDHCIQPYADDEYSRDVVCAERIARMAR